MSFGGGGGSAGKLSTDSDVALSNVTQGDVLQYGSLGKWNNAAPQAKIGMLPFSQPGTLATMTGAGRLVFPVAATIISVTAAVGTAPSGAAVIVDVSKNGTTIFTTQANRPQIAAGANASTTQTPDVNSITAGDYLTVDIDQVGSTTAGSDLTVVIRYRES